MYVSKKFDVMGTVEFFLKTKQGLILVPTVINGNLFASRSSLCLQGSRLLLMEVFFFLLGPKPSQVG